MRIKLEEKNNETFKLNDIHEASTMIKNSSQRQVAFIKTSQ